MKFIISLAAVFASASVLHSQVVVIDPTAIARAQANHAVDLAKYVEMVNNQVTQIQHADAAASADTGLREGVRES